MNQPLNIPPVNVQPNVLFDAGVWRFVAVFAGELRGFANPSSGDSNLVLNSRNFRASLGQPRQPMVEFASSVCQKGPVPESHTCHTASH